MDTSKPKFFYSDPRNQKYYDTQEDAEAAAKNAIAHGNGAQYIVGKAVSLVEKAPPQMNVKTFPA